MPQNDRAPLIDLDLETFLRGRFRGDSVDDVFDEEPEYLLDLLSREEPVLTPPEEMIVRRVTGISYAEAA